MAIVVGIVVVIVVLAILSNPSGAAAALIPALILGAVFYAIGSYFSDGWALFGAILGAISGFAAQEG